VDDATSFAIDYCAANHTRVGKQTLESFIDEHYQSSVFLLLLLVGVFWRELKISFDFLSISPNPELIRGCPLLFFSTSFFFHSHYNKTRALLSSSLKMVSFSSPALNTIVPKSTRAHSLTLPKRFLSLCTPKAARTRAQKGVSVVVVSSTSSPSSEVSTEEEEEKCILWEAAKTSAAMLFVKDGEGKYTACNDALLNRIGFKKEDIIGKNDEDICKKIQNIADTDEEHKRFHAKHSYRGEAITDLPKRWGTNDYLVRSGRIGEGKIFKERYASLVDDKFHEVLVYKTKMSENGTISGIAIPYMG